MVSYAEQNHTISDHNITTANELIESALASDLAYQIVESLTTEIGPRLAGSENEKRARDWALKLGKQLNFDRVELEPFKMPYWTRGDLHISLSKPYKQHLYGTALGGSGFSNKPINAPIVYFRSLDQIKDIKTDQLKNKIAFIDGEPVVKSQTGAGYGPANQRRQVGWQYAQRAGAKALVVRSVGSSSHRFPHTGMMAEEDKKWANIPVIAISNPDADHIQRLHGLKKPISLSIHSTAKWHKDAMSGNIILDLVGREKPEEIVLIGAHLDSWDLGTGAIDDGAGIAITTAAAHLIAQLPQRPKRTIRVVMFGAEEVGLLGAEAYAAKHTDEITNHVLATESDFGAGKIWRFQSNVNEQANSAIDAIAKLLSPLGIIRGPSDAKGGGPDIIPLVELGVPTVRLAQNGIDYFDLHHTPDDTLDKINPEELAQNVAAYAAMVYLAAELDIEFRYNKTDSVSN